MHQTGNWFLSAVSRVYGAYRLPSSTARRYSNLLPLGVVEAHAEHAGVGELVHPLVEAEEDRVEVERGGDLLADVAQQLDVVRPLALGAGQRFSGVGAQLRLPELGPLTLLADHAAPLDAIDHEHGARERGNVQQEGPPLRSTTAAALVNAYTASPLTCP